jgi:hypothetical protein
MKPFILAMCVSFLAGVAGAELCAVLGDASNRAGRYLVSVAKGKIVRWNRDF